jgi:SAM-dependent methyltransferase
MDTNAIKQREKEFHERLRASDKPLPPVSVEWVENTWLSPTWTHGVDRYNDLRREFFAFVERRDGVAGKRVLDYACGTGVWGMYHRLRGAAHVVGFDIAATGVRRGLACARAQHLDGFELLCADATALPFRAASFDLVIGTGVLHHVVKYPGVFPELHRVLAPGCRAYFLENLADNPLFKVWWKLKGEVEEGDVPLFAGQIRRDARQFARVEIVGLDLFHATSHFVFRHPAAAWRRAVLHATKRADDALFRLLPAARRWGANSILVFERGRA